MRIRSTSQNRHVDFICLDRYLVSRPSVKGPPIIDLVFLAWHDHHGTVAVVRALAAHRTQWSSVKRPWPRDPTASKLVPVDCSQSVSPGSPSKRCGTISTVGPSLANSEIVASRLNFRTLKAFGAISLEVGKSEFEAHVVVMGCAPNASCIDPDVTGGSLSQRPSGVLDGTHRIRRLQPDPVSRVGTSFSAALCMVGNDHYGTATAVCALAADRS